MAAPLAAGIALGYLADRRWGDPRRYHPVAGFGQLAGRLERALYADDRARGAAYAAVLVGGAGALGAVAEGLTRGRPVARTLVTAAATWAVLGGRSLAAEAEAVASWLDAGDLAAAREQVSHLVSRDPETLDAAGVARAACESVAENTSDAVVAPLLAGAAAGVPGLLAYRAANTLDAMVGYRTARYLRFGWAAARLDDLLNLVPARVAGALALLAAPLVGGDAAAGRRAIREQAPAHPSPNGGVVEAAFAGVLGVRLGGRNVYGGVVEDRGELGHGRPPRPDDLARANDLARWVSHGACALAVAVAALPRPSRRGRA